MNANGGCDGLIGRLVQIHEIAVVGNRSVSLLRDWNDHGIYYRWQTSPEASPPVANPFNVQKSGNFLIILL